MYGAAAVAADALAPARAPAAAAAEFHTVMQSWSACMHGLVCCLVCCFACFASMTFPSNLTAVGVVHLVFVRATQTALIYSSEMNLFA